MTNLLQAEFYKLHRNKTYWTVLLIVFGITVLVQSLRLSGWWQMSGTAFDRVGLHEINGLAIFTEPLLFNFIVGTLAAFFIANEFAESGVIKNQVMSGKHRIDIFLAKYFVFSFSSVIATVVIPLLVSIIMVFFFGKGDLFHSSSLIYLIRAYSLFILHLLSFTGLIIWIAIVTEDSAKTILYTFLLTVVAFAMEHFLPPSFIKSTYENSFFYQYTLVFEQMTTAEIVYSVVIGIISLAIILLCDVSMFQKKEIH